MRRAAPALILLAVALAFVAGGCGSEEPESAAPTPEETRERLADSPAPLAALHDQASELLDGDEQALDARLRELRGHPVVINKWASWCTPCRAEFPFFQRVAVEYGTRVAFLGLNSEDNREEAAEFLAEFPVSFPSYVDPKGDLARDLDLTTGFPMTLFLDAQGEVVERHIGGYATEEKLGEDVQRALSAAS